MFVSDAKREANRRNALKSTGPKTEEGKAVSRRNAVKHGLCSSVVMPEDADAVEERYKELFFDLKPRTQLQNYCISEMVVLTLRIDRVERMERRVRDKAALRAMTSWDEDRGLEAERIARGLAASPAEVVAELKRTPQGCDWLIGRWAMLAFAAESGTGWDEGRRALAFDLLGTPAEFRFANPGAKIDGDGRLIDDGSRPAEVARGQIARVREAREVAAEHDEVERALTEADLAHEPDPEIRRLRRYESTLHHRLRWFLARFRDPVDMHRIPKHLLPSYAQTPDGGLRMIPKGSFYGDPRFDEFDAAAAEFAAGNEATPEGPNEATAAAENEPKIDAEGRNEAKSDGGSGAFAHLNGAAIGREDAQDGVARPHRESWRAQLQPQTA